MRKYLLLTIVFVTGMSLGWLAHSNSLRERGSSPGSHSSGAKSGTEIDWSQSVRISKQSEFGEIRLTPYHVNDRGNKHRFGPVPEDGTDLWLINIGNGQVFVAATRD